MAEDNSIESGSSGWFSISVISDVVDFLVERSLSDMKENENEKYESGKQFVQIEHLVLKSFEASS